MNTREKASLILIIVNILAVQEEGNKIKEIVDAGGVADIGPLLILLIIFCVLFLVCIYDEQRI